MDWVTTFAEDFALFELTTQESLLFFELTRARQTDQLSPVVIPEIF